MGLKITPLGAETVTQRVTVDRRLWVTADGNRLVGDGHVEAATLLIAPNRPIARAELEKYELDESLTEVVPVEEGAAAEADESKSEGPSGEGAEPAEAEEAEAGEPPAELEEEKPKRGRRGADKAVKGPQRDKAAEGG